MSQKENNMRICEVYGNLTSEKSSENYPTDLYCTDCFLEMDPYNEDPEKESKLVNHRNDDGSFGDTCSNCGKTKSEDDEYYDQMKKLGFAGLSFDDYTLDCITTKKED
jgi:hypothetical protein